MSDDTTDLDLEDFNYKAGGQEAKSGPLFDRAKRYDGLEPETHWGKAAHPWNEFTKHFIEQHRNAMNNQGSKRQDMGSTLLSSRAQFEQTIADSTATIQASGTSET